MELRELLAGADVIEISGDPQTEITSLAYDSRRAEPGSLFFCYPGTVADGHAFAPSAIQAGARALCVERKLELAPPVTRVLVGDGRSAMAHAAARFFDDPTAELRIVGITGTNGKTTTAFHVREILEAAGVQTGLLGTVKRVVGGVSEPVERTTPEAIDLQATFRRMADGGDRACAMEVSSHALALRRTDGIRFAVAAFTNLTQDHLDFHADMEDYFGAKRRLFLGDRAERAVINLDDPSGASLVEIATRPVTYAINARADVMPRSFEMSLGGLRGEVATPKGPVAIAARAPAAVKRRQNNPPR